MIFIFRLSSVLGLLLHNLTFKMSHNYELHRLGFGTSGGNNTLLIILSPKTLLEQHNGARDVALYQ